MDNFEHVLSPAPSNIFIKVKTGTRNVTNSLKGDAKHHGVDGRTDMTIGKGVFSKKHRDWGRASRTRQT